MKLFFPPPVPPECLTCTERIGFADFFLVLIILKEGGCLSPSSPGRATGTRQRGAGAAKHETPGLSWRALISRVSNTSPNEPHPPGCFGPGEVLLALGVAVAGSLQPPHAGSPSCGQTQPELATFLPAGGEKAACSAVPPSSRGLAM